MAAKAPATHDERSMTELLRAHYLPPSKGALGIFAPQITSPDGSRQADLIWMPTTIAGGRGLHGHEIKVSRADVLAELANPDKSEAWAKYCSRWWLVVSDPSLVEDLPVPDSWGIMSPPSGRRRRTMTVLRPAPKLDPHGNGAGFAKVASWLHYKGFEERYRANLRLDARQRELDRAREQMEAMRVGGSSRNFLTDEDRQLLDLMRAVKQRLRDRPGYARLDLGDPRLVDILTDYAAARTAVEVVAHQGTYLANAIKRVAAMLEDPLGRAKSDVLELELMSSKPGDIPVDDTN